MRSKGVLAIAVLALVVAGCQPTAAASVSSIRADFPVVEQLHVTRFMTVDGCDYMAYTRGAFVTDPSSDACNVDVDGPRPRLAFDAQARADLNTLLRESERHGPRLQHGYVTFGQDGNIAPDSWFGFSWDQDFVYDPAVAANAKSEDSTCEEPINAEWYRVWPC